MLFTETAIEGVVVVELERHADERGFFARSWCRREFQAAGLNSELVQCNISFNHRKGTLRGMHYQVAPHEEVKLVRCTAGAIHDVVIDLRRDSATYMEWLGLELNAENRRMLYIPEGVAHGFLTLSDNAEVHYQMSAYFAPECARGVRWNDPAFGIEWPDRVVVIADRDAQYPDFEP